MKSPKSVNVERGAALHLGAAAAMKRDYKTGVDYLYCRFRQKLSIRKTTRAFWEGAAVYVMTEITN